MKPQGKKSLSIGDATHKSIKVWAAERGVEMWEAIDLAWTNYTSTKVCDVSAESGPRSVPVDRVGSHERLLILIDQINQRDPEAAGALVRLAGSVARVLGTADARFDIRNADAQRLVDAAEGGIDSAIGAATGSPAAGTGGAGGASATTEKLVKSRKPASSA